MSEHGIVSILPEHEPYWQDARQYDGPVTNAPSRPKPKATSQNLTEMFAERVGVKPPWLEEVIQAFTADMQYYSYRPGEIRDFLRSMADSICDCKLNGHSRYDVVACVCGNWWREVFDPVETRTKRNRQIGKFRGRNSLGVLKPRTEEWIGELGRNPEKMDSMLGQLESA